MESEAIRNPKMIEAKIQELFSELHEISGKDISLLSAQNVLCIRILVAWECVFLEEASRSV